MRLKPRPFDLISCGKKTIELRLNDEKRQKVKIGDHIVFSNSAAPEETITVKVTALHRFSDFAELYTALPLDKCGYSLQEIATASPADMDKYYSPAEQKLYGVLGIEIEKVMP